MQMEKERVHYEVHQNCLVVYVTDDLDHHAVLQLREYSDRLIEAGNIRHIIFDFTDVGFMDSSGIGVIIGRYKKISYFGGKIFAVNADARIKRTLMICGLHKVIEIM